jgi:hypothetical protein
MADLGPLFSNPVASFTDSTSSAAVSGASRLGLLVASIAMLC